MNKYIGISVPGASIAIVKDGEVFFQKDMVLQILRIKYL